jgi:plastocyanin
VIGRSPRRGARRAVAATVLAIAVVAFAACGDNGGGSSSYKEPSGPAQTTLTIEGGNFFFEPKDSEVPAGIDAIKLESTQGLHTLVFDDDKVPGFKLEAGSGESDELKVDLRRGEYTIYCDIPGHREGGMEGTITVR